MTCLRKRKESIYETSATIKAAITFFLVGGERKNRVGGALLLIGLLLSVIDYLNLKYFIMIISYGLRSYHMEYGPSQFKNKKNKLNFSHFLQKLCLRFFFSLDFLLYFINKGIS